MEELRQHWIISATTAKKAIASGATILDVRNWVSWFFHHVPGAIPIHWQDFCYSHTPDKGKLLEDETELNHRLRDRGISRDKPVVVIGYPYRRFSFGEEGRIVWMLRTLGHPAVAFVDAGQRAIEGAGVATTWGWVRPDRGDFTVQKRDDWQISRDRLRQHLDEFALIDSRELREYAGKTPYGERRGGHLPRAIHLYFKDLLNLEGKLLPKETLRSRLATAGITPEMPVVAYCTGGIRSGFMVAVLVELGFTNAKNYPGSTWEWSAASPQDYPLVQSS